MRFDSRVTIVAGVAVAVFAAIGAVSLAYGDVNDSSHKAHDHGVVYTETNSPAGNVIVEFKRDGSGHLTQSATYATGGTGTGGGLGSQGAVILAEGGRYLVAVNAGSSEVSAFAVTGNHLRLLNTVPSGGSVPVSVTADHGRVFVVNASGTASISGFRLDQKGLHPIDGWTRVLPAGAAGPAQIGFTPDGGRLVVTLKASNRIDTVAVNDNGPAGAVVSTPSTGATPFGFSFDGRGHLLVSNAEGGVAGASTVTSYRVAANGALTTITGSVHTGQTAACWLVTTSDGRVAFTTNFGSNSISSFSVGRDGAVSLHQSVAATSDAGPIDAAITGDDRLLYVLNGPGHSITAYQIDRAPNALASAPQAGVSDLPAGTAGLAVT